MYQSIIQRIKAPLVLSHKKYPQTNRGITLIGRKNQGCKDQTFFLRSLLKTAKNNIPIESIYIGGPLVSAPKLKTNQKRYLA
jgi:hypothetical protein